MNAPMNVSPEWVQEHATIAAWALGVCLLTLVSLGGYFAKNLFSIINAGLADIKVIKEITTIQSENHLSTIQVATLDTRDETIKTNAKLDTLIDVMQKRL